MLKNQDQDFTAEARRRGENQNLLPLITLMNAEKPGSSFEATTEVTKEHEEQ
jgi:hypothetical protein